MTATQNGNGFRLLILGGKSKDVPRDRILCSFEHLDSDDARNKRGEITFSPGKEPHLILAFKDYINHGPVERYKAAAKLLGVPFVCASGGFWALVNKARAMGLDVGPLIQKVERKPTGQLVKPPESENDLDPNMVAWINNYPTSAFKMNASGAQEVPVIHTRAGLSLVFKGRPLEFALALVKQHKMGTGKRGSVSQKEAREIASRLEAIYELKKYGVNAPKTITIIKHIGFVMGTLSPSMLKQIEGRKVKGEPRPLRPYKQKEPSEPPTPRPAPEPTPEPEPEPVPKPEVAIRDSHIKISEKPPEPPAPEEPAPEPIPPAAEDALDRISKLYERLITAQTENTAYIEQIGQLEGEVKRQKDRIKELEEKLRALAR